MSYASGAVLDGALETHYNSNNYIRISNGSIRFIGTNENVGLRVGPNVDSTVATLKLEYNSGYNMGYIKTGGNGKFVLDNITNPRFFTFISSKDKEDISGFKLVPNLLLKNLVYFVNFE